MDCSEAREKMELRALGGLEAEQRGALERHLRDCPDCRDRMAEYDFVVEGLRQEAVEDGPGGQWKEAASEALEREIERERRPGVFGRFAWGAAAAAAAVVLVLGWHALTGGGEGRDVGKLASLSPDARQWTRDGLLSGSRSSSPGYVMDGGRIYALRRRATGRYVCALDAESGRHLWRSRLPAIGYLSTTGSQVLCLSAGDGGNRLEVVALDKQTGAVQWRFGREKPRRVHSLTRPLAAGDDRICWALGGTVHALDPETGTRMWSREVSTSAEVSAPALAGGAVLVASGRRIVCLGLEDGAERWHRALPGELQGADRPLVALSGNRAFLVQKDPLGPDTLCCMDLRTRTVDWTRWVDRAFDVLARDGVVCLRGRRVEAYEAGNGELLWTRASEGCGPLTAAGDAVQYVDSAGQGSVVAVDLRTGAPRWRMRGLRSCDAFVRLGGTGYVKTRRGTLQAISLHSSPGL